MAVTISECGAALHAWRAPDRYGRIADVLLAAPDRHGPLFAPPRWQGRRAGGGVALRRITPDAAELQLSYHLDDDGNLVVEHAALAAAPTPCPAQPPPCFNLNSGDADVGGHMLQICADYYVEVDAGGMPAGVATVGGTPFDFRHPAPIGARLCWPDTQIQVAGGFDHCFFVGDHYAGGQGALREVARVIDPGSGRRLQMYSTEAVLQFRAGGPDAEPPAAPHRWRRGLSLHAQPRPSLVSQGWPQLMLRPGEVYRQTTVYRLSLQR
ncbi:hypothetical protein RugamoR64_04640 [Duganella rhizosphaerae]